MSERIPRVVAIGKTGDGKTAFLNNLLQLKDDPFIEHNEMKIVVKEGYWLGDEKKGKVIAVDSPGAFIETNLKVPDEVLSDLFYIEFSKEISKGIDCIFLVLDINTQKWDVQFSSIVAMLALIFDMEIRKHFAFVFTHCDPDKKDEWLPKKQEIEKTWNKNVSLNSGDDKLDYPLIFTSKFTTEGLENIPELVRKMGSYSNPMMDKIYSISQDETQSNKDIQEAIEQRFKEAIKGEVCSIL